MGFSSIPLFISHSTSPVCFFSLSTSGSCGRVFFVIADIADQAVPCNNNPSCGCAAALLHEVASMSGKGGSEREREGEKESKRERAGGSEWGGSRPTNRRRRGDASKVTAALSLKSTKNRTGKKAKRAGGDVGRGQGNCRARSQPYSVVCVRSPLPAPFCIIAIFSSATKISYPLKPSREAWKLALLPTRRKISNATLAAGTEVLARVPTERKTNKQKKKDSLPRKRH